MSGANAVGEFLRRPPFRSRPTRTAKAWHRRHGCAMERGCEAGSRKLTGRGQRDARETRAQAAKGFLSDERTVVIGDAPRARRLGYARIRPELQAKGLDASGAASMPCSGWKAPARQRPRRWRSARNWRARRITPAAGARQICGFCWPWMVPRPWRRVVRPTKWMRNDVVDAQRHSRLMP